jgi:acylphosphatase
MLCIHIKVHGIVQGVFFRKFTQQKANALGIKGWVKNSEDSTVEIEAEAALEVLENFIHWCHRGPDRAVVNKVEVTESALKNFTSFEIRK